MNQTEAKDTEQAVQIMEKFPQVGDLDSSASFSANKIM